MWFLHFGERGGALSLMGFGVCIAVNFGVGCCGCQGVCDCCGLAVCRFSLSLPLDDAIRRQFRAPSPDSPHPHPANTKGCAALRVVKSPRDNPSPFDVAWLIGVLRRLHEGGARPSGGTRQSVGRLRSVSPVTCRLLARLWFLNVVVRLFQPSRQWRWETRVGALDLGVEFREGCPVVLSLGARSCSPDSSLNLSPLNSRGRRTER